MDEGLFYKTTRVVVRRGLIVGFRALVTAGKQKIEDNTPIRIADLPFDDGGLCSTTKQEEDWRS